MDGDGRTDGSIDIGKGFMDELTAVIKQAQPRRLLETGTWVGTGSTKTICEAINNIWGSRLYTIEVNPARYKDALVNTAGHTYCYCLNGLSVPRSRLPTVYDTRDEIKLCLSKGILVDNLDEHGYAEETEFTVADDMIWTAMQAFGWNLDFAFLDSAGSMGWIEFQYLLPLLKQTCIIALDDTRHIKHWRTREHILGTPKKFAVIADNNERNGYMIVRYFPGG